MAAHRASSALRVRARALRVRACAWPPCAAAAAPGRAPPLSARRPLHGAELPPLAGDAAAPPPVEAPLDASLAALRDGGNGDGGAGDGGAGAGGGGGTAPRLLLVSEGRGDLRVVELPGGGAPGARAGAWAGAGRPARPPAGAARAHAR